MDEGKEVTGTISVPRNTGIEGFLETIRQLLRRPRVQEIRIDARGQVSFRRWAIEGEDFEANGNNFGVDLSHLKPYHIVRNAQAKEFMPDERLSAAVVVGMMFDKAAQENLSPLAFVTGAGTTLWEWYRFTTGYKQEPSDTFFGLPLLRDRQIPDTVLLLCAGHGRNASFIDTQVSYKVEMPSYTFPSTEVQVMP